MPLSEARLKREVSRNSASCYWVNGLTEWLSASLGAPRASLVTL